MPRTRRNPVLQNDANAPTQRKTYHRILVTFMEYKNSVEYEADKTFAVEEIQTIHPDDIFKWFCFKAYGTEDPGEDDIIRQLLDPLHLSTTRRQFHILWKATEAGTKSVNEATQQNVVRSIV